MDRASCPRCGFRGPDLARFCAHCGQSFIPRRARMADWLDRNPKPLGAALAAVFLGAIYLAAHTLTEFGLFFRGSYALWLLAVGGVAIYLGRSWKIRTSPGRRALHSLVALLVLASAVTAVRLLDEGIVAHAVADDWGDAFVLPGIELRASRFNTQAGAEAFLERHSPHSGYPNTETSAPVAPSLAPGGVRRVATRIRAVGDGYVASSLHTRRVDLAYILVTLLYIVGAAALAARLSPVPGGEASVPMH